MNKELEDMTKEEFIEACKVDPQERTFLSMWDDIGNDMHAKERNGQKVQVLGLADPDGPNGYDWFETGPLYRIRFPDGAETQAWPEEIGLGASLVDGELWPHPDLTDDEIGPDAPYATWEEWARLTREGKL